MDDRAEGTETSNPDPAILRQINALVSTLPSMNADTFVEELAMVRVLIQWQESF